MCYSFYLVFCFLNHTAHVAQSVHQFGQVLYGSPQTCDQILLVLRGLILKTFVIPQLFMFCHQLVKVCVIYIYIVILSLLPDGLVKHVVQTFMMPRWFVPVTLVILWLFLFSHHEVDIVKYQNYNVLEWNLVQTFLINCHIFGETLTLHGFKHLCALLGEFLFTDHTIIQITHESWFVTFHICNHN